MTYATYPSLAGRGVLITGGAMGIGAALVEAFAGQGAHVAFCDVAEAAGADLAARLAAAGASVRFRAVDVMDPAGLQAFIVEEGGARGLHALVNNAAWDDRHRLDEVTPDYFRKNMAVNFEHVFWATQAAAPLMRSSGCGSIVNLSSITAYLGHSDLPIYVAMKAAILGFTRSSARELGPAGIRVNAIVPGWIVTERQLEKWLTAEAEAKWMAETALKRRLLPDDVARLALFLAAEDSSAITGQAHIIDGGRI